MTYLSVERHGFVSLQRSRELPNVNETLRDMVLFCKFWWTTGSKLIKSNKHLFFSTVIVLNDIMNNTMDNQKIGNLVQNIMQICLRDFGNAQLHTVCEFDKKKCLLISFIMQNKHKKNMSDLDYDHGVGSR